MSQVLADAPLLTIFLVVAVGAALGAIRFGPVRLGAAGALFIGLALSAWQPELSKGFSLVQQIGLALFVYSVGLASGATFVAAFKKNLPLMLASVLGAGLGAVVAGLGGKLLGLSSGLTAGLFTGALTAAPALETASQLVEGNGPAVGYSSGYPIGVIVGIVAVSLVVTRPWQGKNDSPALAGRGLAALTVRVRDSVLPQRLPEWRDQLIHFSYISRSGKTRVLVPGEELLPGDDVVIVGEPGAPEAVAGRIGEVLPQHLADDRSSVEFERIVLSNPDLTGRPVAALRLPALHGALVTRVRRGDLDLLAREDLNLQAGDNLAVVVPADQLDAVKAYLGDSQKKVSEIDALSLGLGLVLGVLVGLVTLPLPGGMTFRLGVAAGPLVVGMILGALRRTGPITWSMPESANLTMRHLGLLLFLAALGLSAGPDVAALLSSPLGWKALLLATVIAVVGVTVVIIVGGLQKLSAPRTAGGVAGFLGQPAVLQAADARVQDERVESAYGALFAFAILVKILLVPLVLVF